MAGTENLIEGFSSEIQLIRGEKCFRQNHSPPEEELHPEPAVPGVVVTEEVLGDAGERW